MFMGTMPKPVTQILHEHLRRWGTKDVWMGCSGNFTIERAIADMGLTMHSNDVSLYSSAIGTYLAGGELAVTINPDYREQFPFLEDSIKTPSGLVATLALCTQMLKGMKAENAYFKRWRKAYADQWPKLLEKTKARVEAVPVKLASFYCGDVMEYMDEIPPSSAFISFPPFYTGGYEKLNAGIDKVFQWEAPVYEMFDEKTSLEMLLQKAQEKEHWFVGTKERIDWLEPNLVGVVKMTNRGKAVYCYSDTKKARVIMPKQKIAVCMNEKLGPEDVITKDSTITLARLSQEEFAAIRSEFLDPAISPAPPLYSLAVLVDGKLAGCCAFTNWSQYSRINAEWPVEMIYMMSDFPVAGSRYPRLSKLILYAATSKEAQGIHWRMTKQPVRSIATTAFARKDVSMKYRGIFTLTKKEEVGGDRPFKLNYCSLAGRWTLKEGLAEWCDRFAKGGSKDE